MGLCVRNRWVTLTAGMYILVVSGHPYGFGVYSSALKETLGCSQRELNLISSYGNFSMYIGVFAGLFCDRFGSARTALVGAFLALVGYLLLWATIATDFLPTPREPWIVSVFFAVAWQSVSWLDTAGLTPSLRNFPGNRGSIVGLLKSGLGLFSSCIAQVFLALFSKRKGEKRLDIFFLLALVVSLTALCASPFLNAISNPSFTVSTGGKRRLKIASCVILTICTYLGVAMFFQDKWTKAGVEISFYGMDISVIFTSVTLVLLSAIAFLPVGSSRIENVYGECPSEDEDEAATDLRASLLVEPLAAEQLHVMDVNCLKMLQQVEAWVIIFVFFCAGSALIVINNIAQISGALENPHVGMMLIAIGIANSLGRLVIGYCSDRTKQFISRPMWLMIVLAIMALGHLQLAFATADTMLVGMVLVVSAFGGCWVLVPTLVSEIFGFTHFGSNYQTITFVGPAVGGFVMSVGLAGHFYDTYADPTTKKCIGNQCFHETFMVASAACVAGLTACTVLLHRTRDFYAKKIKITHAPAPPDMFFPEALGDVVPWGDDTDYDPRISATFI